MFDIHFINPESRDPERLFEVFNILNENINENGHVIVDKTLKEYISRKINYKNIKKTQRDLVQRYIDSIISIGLYQKIKQDTLSPVYDKNLNINVILSNISQERCNTLFLYKLIDTYNLNYLSVGEINLLYYLQKLNSVNNDNTFLENVSKYIIEIRKNGSQEILKEILSLCFNEKKNNTAFFFLFSNFKNNNFKPTKNYKEFYHKLIDSITDKKTLKLPILRSVNDYSTTLIKYLGLTHVFFAFKNKNLKHNEKCIRIKNHDRFLFLNKKEREETVSSFLYNHHQDDINSIFDDEISPDRNLTIKQIKGKKAIYRNKKLPIDILKEHNKCFFDDIKHHNYEYYDIEKQKPILEVHHFIHMSNAEKIFKEYEKNIDSKFNMIPICACCHKAIHHASKERKNELNLYIYNKLKIELNHHFPYLDFNILKERGYF